MRQLAAVEVLLLQAASAVEEEAEASSAGGTHAHGGGGTGAPPSVLCGAVVRVLIDKVWNGWWRWREDPGVAEGWDGMR